MILGDELEAEVREAAAALQGRTTPGTDPEVAKLATLIGKIAEELRGDEMLATAIAESKRVFLCAYFASVAGTARAEPDKLRLARHGEVADGGTGGQRRPLHTTRVNFTLDDIGRGPIGAGAVNSFRDDDGVPRRVPLAIEYGGRHYMPLGLVGGDSMTAGGMQLPLTKAASIPLDVLGRGGLPTVSAAEVIAGTAPASALANKLAFVGMTYASFDKVQTPLDKIADGVELHATLAENILSGHLLTLGGPFATLLATLALCGVMAI